MISEPQLKAFPNASLLSWYERIKRNLPWRETKEPYSVWLSEIILQQTRVDQGLPYYERFISKFPGLSSLALATEDEVLKCWEGLGYYSRARNLHFTAKYIHTELNGLFPKNYDELLLLKGIGPYTAAAISSIVSNECVAAVDGNVFRVLSRYYGIMESIDESSTKKEITARANTIVPKNAAGDHNQAMMELGATVCSPTEPKCSECPIKLNCVTFANELQSTLPIRTKKTKVRARFFHYVVRMNPVEILIRKRGSGDIWEGLYEFPYVETENRLSDAELLNIIKLGADDQVLSMSEEYSHILSHQRIYARFVVVRSNKLNNNDLIKVKVSKLSSFALPKLINRFIDKQGLVIDKEV